MQMSYSDLPRSLRRAALALGLCTTLGATGCVYGNVESVLRSQVASEMNCPETRVRTRPVYELNSQPGHYLVTGCGVKRIYDCPKDAGMVSYDDEICTLIPDANVQPEGPAAPSDPMTEDMGADEPMSDDTGDTNEMGEEPSQESGDLGGDAEADVGAEAEPAPSKSKFKASGKFKLE